MYEWEYKPNWYSSVRTWCPKLIGHSMCTNTCKTGSGLHECGFTSRNVVWKFLQKDRQAFLNHLSLFPSLAFSLSISFLPSFPLSPSLSFIPLTLPFSFYRILNKWKLLKSEIKLTLLILNSLLIEVEKWKLFFKGI